MERVLGGMEQGRLLEPHRRVLVGGRVGVGRCGRGEGEGRGMRGDWDLYF